MAQSTRPTSRRDFEIAIICALTLEADAVVALFDRYWDDEEERGDASPYDKALGDANAYTAGRIGRHNVVVAHLPRDGKARAANAASYCRMSWPAIKLALVVGICGAVPFTADGDEIILGDVIISEAIVQYDLGRQLPGHFVRKNTLLDSLSRPSEEIMGLIAKLKGVRDKKRDMTKMGRFMALLRDNSDLTAEYPGVTYDRLFAANYRHLDHGKTCDDAGCGGELTARKRLAKDKPKSSIHFGLIASGDTVIKSGESRDIIAKKEGVIAFEMESAGLWGVFPCVVIKGVCDYADSHKEKRWQRYAAATAASCARVFLEHWVPSPQVSNRIHNRREERQMDRRGLHRVVETTEMGGTPTPTPQPPKHYLPSLIKRNFVGRSDFMNALRQKLFDTDGRAAHRFAVLGLGGVGKTQVALNIANWTMQNKPDWHVFWLPALSMATFEQACRDVSQLLGLDGAKHQDAKELVRCFLDSDQSGHWLLIIDNADDEELVEGNGGDEPRGIRDFLPQSGRGRTLFTTRDLRIATRLAQRDVVILERMDANEARDLLKQSLRDMSLLSDEEDVTSLLDVLTHLPLAIIQAAAYLNETMESIPEYMRLLQNTERDMLELLETEFSDETRYCGAHNAVARTWAVSFEQIRKNQDAFMLLSFISYVERKAISRSMLPPVGSEQRMTRAIGVLCGYSFLSRREDRLVYDMHRLVHVASRAWEATRSDAAERRRHALQHLRTIFSTSKWEERERWQHLLPHVLRAIDIEETGKAWCDDESHLGYWAGKCLNVEGRNREAAMLLERVVKIEGTTLGEMHPHRLASQYSLAKAYRAEGKVQDAINLLEKIVAIEEATLSSTHPDRLASQQELAGVYQEDGRAREAIDLLEKIVAIRETSLSETHHERLSSQHSLAKAYQENGRLPDAIKLLEKIVAIEEKTLAETHPDRLASQNNLAVAYYDVGQIDKAIKLIRHVVSVRQRVLRKDHPHRLHSERLLETLHAS